MSPDQIRDRLLSSGVPEDKIDGAFEMMAGIDEMVDELVVGMQMARAAGAEDEFVMEYAEFTEQFKGWPDDAGVETMGQALLGMLDRLAKAGPVSAMSPGWLRKNLGEAAAERVLAAQAEALRVVHEAIKKETER